MVTPNVRAKQATTAGRRARPGGLPLALRLSEGLGVIGVRVDI